MTVAHAVTAAATEVMRLQAALNERNQQLADLSSQLVRPPTHPPTRTPALPRTLTPALTRTLTPALTRTLPPALTRTLTPALTHPQPNPPTCRRHRSGPWKRALRRAWKRACAPTVRPTRRMATAVRWCDAVRRRVRQCA